MQHYDRTGQQLGNYRLSRLLGQGGFADVYLAEHTHLGTEAAIKVLATRLLGDELERFREEARTIARLKHPHIIRILDFGIDNTIPFLVMEYAVGGTLRQRHPRGTRVPLSVVVSYVKQVADALQYAHDRKLIHRDIKPENMLLGESNELLLSDFGIAIISQSSRSAQTQDTTGTIAYMAPEQIQAHPRPASDQYALGIVTYEWLSGAPPFQGSFMELAAKHLLTPPAPLSQHLPNISSMVEQVVMTALAKDPKERFGSVQAFANALEQAGQGSPVSPSPLPPRSTPPPASRRPSHVVAPPIQSPSRTDTDPSMSDYYVKPEYYQSERSTGTPPERSASPRSSGLAGNEIKRRERPIQPIERSSSDNLSVPRRSGIPKHGNVPPHSAARVSSQPEASLPMLSRRAILLSIAGAGVMAIGGGIVWFVRTHSQGSLLYTYRGHSDTVTSVTWSPDGARIASTSDDKTVQVWNATDGAHPYTYTGHTDRVNGVAWSHEGTHIASASNDTTVQVWNATDGTHPYTYTGHAGAVLGVAWSPNGSRMASASFDGTVEVWNAADGTNPYIYKGHAAAVNAVAWSPDGLRIASGGNDFTVQVWNAADGTNPYIYKGHAAAVQSVEWSSDSKRIASASDDGTVQVWDAADGNNPYTYNSYSKIVYAAAWSPDSVHIASASDDGTVQVWNSIDGTNPYVYKGHSGAVLGVAWSPDGTYVASASDDQTVQVWRAV